MPRNAITLAKLHPVADVVKDETASDVLKVTRDGKWILLAGPDISLAEQQKHFQSLLGTKSHEKFCEVRYQEDGYTEARVLKFLDPAALKAKLDAQEAAQKKIDADRQLILDEQKKREVEAQKLIDDERQEAVDKKNAATAETKDATGKPTAAAESAKKALSESPRANRGK